MNAVIYKEKERKRMVHCVLNNGRILYYNSPAHSYFIEYDEGCEQHDISPDCFGAGREVSWLAERKASGSVVN